MRFYSLVVSSVRRRSSAASCTESGRRVKPFTSKSVEGMYFAIARIPTEDVRNENKGKKMQEKGNEKMAKNQTQSQHFTTLNRSSTLSFSPHLPCMCTQHTRSHSISNVQQKYYYWSGNTRLRNIEWLWRKWQNGCERPTEWMGRDRRRRCYTATPLPLPSTKIER